MTGYLAFGLIRYHQLTGDTHVLKLLHLLAEGLYAESKRSSGIFNYSPFPQINNLWVKTDKARWNAMNTLFGGLCGYLYFVSGEKIYAQRAIECYPTQKSFDQGASVGMDMLPLAGWMLRVVAQFKEKN
ncbi:MAG: hypothetical protein ABI254_07955, partial [Chthoniobacterales bacterium]